MKLTKEVAARISAKLLMKIYDENVNAVATIVNAKAKAMEGDESGYTTLADALSTARDIIQELIDAMIYEKE
ncbi:MAG: hypothetical protein J6S67_00265 [Methanobrevibacter sp.]|nr:hypothetical protein [Methanobrevibacter sp.]